MLTIHGRQLAGFLHPYSVCHYINTLVPTLPLPTNTCIVYVLQNTVLINLYIRVNTAAVCKMIQMDRYTAVSVATFIIHHTDCFDNQVNSGPVKSHRTVAHVTDQTNQQHKFLDKFSQYNTFKNVSYKVRQLVVWFSRQVSTAVMKYNTIANTVILYSIHTRALTLLSVLLCIEGL